MIPFPRSSMATMDEQYGKRKGPVEFDVGSDI
jgi:hypothetical protein